MADTIVPFPGLTETERKTRLFAWADRLLQELGLIDQIEKTNDLADLRKIAFDVEAVEVTLAIQEALYPEDGGRVALCFVNIGKRALKAILKARFAEAKRLRAQKLERGDTTTTTSGTSTAYDWTADLKIDRKGAVLSLLANLILFLRHHPKWQGVFAFDEFANRVTIRKSPPWGTEAADTVLTDHHETKTRTWFQREDIKAAQGDVGRAIQSVAKDAPFHPVREYFDALVWDDTPRINAWLQTYLNADDTPYARAVGPRFLISGVARIYKPGCKVDHMLVLEGPQGKLKSEALRKLAVKDAWFIDRISHLAGKDAVMELCGALLIEIAEMDALVKAAASTSKGFLTRPFDKFRPPYGKHTINLPRQCIFGGTINPPVGGYLKDPTGARRFWPVTCRGRLDIVGIERDRDQLWAEAIVRYRAGAPWWLETPELEALATAEQAARFKIDIWQEQVEKWIGDREEVGVSEVLEHALGITAEKATRSAEMRVAGILTNLGFTRCRPNKDGDRRRKYRRN